MGSLEEILIEVLFEAERKQKIAHVLNSDDLQWLKNYQSEHNSSCSDSQGSFEEIDEKLLEEDITDSALSQNCQDIYVGCKNKIGVYYESNNNLQLKGSFPVVIDYEAQEFFPKMLLPYDSSIMTVDETKPTTVYTIDVNKGKVKSTHKITNNSPITAISGVTKQVFNEYIALTKNQIFTVDPRVSDYIVQNYTYTKNPKLTSLVSTEEGFIAIGNQKGEIRLYSKVGQKAKTCFPGFGNNIYAIDCTLDGSWLLGTTDTYLIVLPTTAYGVNGYKKSITKKRRKAKRLQLTPADIVKYKLSCIKFTPARFNLSNSEENAIITSTANILIIWNFKSVKQGKVYNYKIRPLAQEIIKNEFIKGKDEAIITYKKGLEVQSKSKPLIN